MNDTLRSGERIVKRVTFAGYERLANQVIHWVVVLIVCAFIFVLRLRNELDTASVTALYGGTLGHLGLASVHRGGSRSGDPDGGG